MVTTAVRFKILKVNIVGQKQVSSRVAEASDHPHSGSKEIGHSFNIMEMHTFIQGFWF